MAKKKVNTEEKQLERIQKLQVQYGLDKTQNLINTGEIWKFEGAMGRQAMALLESGACYLPTTATRDYYGNRIPSREELRPMTKGTLSNSVRFWDEVEAGRIDMDADFDDEG